MAKFNMLVVDDDHLVTESVKMLVPEAWAPTICHSSSQVPINQRFHAAFVDLHLTGNLSKSEGIEVIAQLKERNPTLEIVAISGDFNRGLMEAALKAGASRFLAKPLHDLEFILTLEKIEALCLLIEASSRRPSQGAKWVGESNATSQVFKWLASMKGEAGPILIEGASGTGKEVVAQLLNQQEKNSHIVAINVAAIPENLFESEFFGHVKGSFTGAEANKMGLAEVAANGDLFLDEIEALSPSLQVKLLRFLETGEVRRIGGKDSQIISTRVIAASNQPLERLVKEGRFREDLYFRLKGKTIELPPLRDRKTDIIPLAKYFLGKDTTRRKTLAEDAKEALENYGWPGNVRELKRVIEQLVLVSPLPIVRGLDILSIFRPDSILQNSTSLDLDLNLGLSSLIESYEKTVITTCLKKFKDIEDAAKMLKISRSSLYKKISDHSIEWKR